MTQREQPRSKFCRFFKQIERVCPLTAADYLETYKAIQDHKLDEAHINMKWNENFNGRYGDASVIGETSELLAVYVLHQMYDSVTKITSRMEQLSQGDVIVNQPNWDKPKTIEIKTAALTKIYDIEHVKLHHKMLARMRTPTADNISEYPDMLGTVCLRSNTLLLMPYKEAMDTIRRYRVDPPWLRGYAAIPTKRLRDVCGDNFRRKEIRIPTGDNK